MKRFVPWLAVLILAVPASRAEDKKANFEVVVEKNIAYNPAEDAHPERHKLDLYLPKGAKSYPVLFFIHGGAWKGGKKDLYGAIGQVFARQGIGFVATNYRLSPLVQHPGHIEDVAQAFAWCHANLGKRGADVKRLFVTGHSAGGHLTALLASDDSYLKKYKLSPADIKGAIPISGVFDVSHDSLSSYFGKEGKKASPMTYIKEKTPPLLVLYADKELANLGKQAEEFARASKEVKRDIDVRMIKDRDHISIIRNAAKPDDEVTVAIVEFVNKLSAAK